MQRRRLLQLLAATPVLAGPGWSAPPDAARKSGPRLLHRVRPGQPGWPGADQWQALARQVGGRLQPLQSPFTACSAGRDTPACVDTLKQIDNPFFISDTPALTQTSGWADAWQSRPSTWAVKAESAADVAAAVDFARKHRLRLVVKGGGHSYQGTSCAPDSLLVWTRPMQQVQLHDAFVARDCPADTAQPAVSLGAGALWIDAYHAVTTQAGRYVQGGGCTTVGVAGLVQSGGFGNFSKRYGSASAALIEAEVVTAEGQIRIANACNHQDLFWALKGGGGGSFGVVTRLTLRTRELPQWFGAVFATIRARSDDAFRELIAKVIALYQQQLFNPHWGETLRFGRGNKLDVSMVFQELDEAAAKALWAPLADWITEHPGLYFSDELEVHQIPARHFWDIDFFRRHAPGFMSADDRPGTPAHHSVWTGNRGQAGQFLHGYQSAWLPATLLQPARQAELCDALFAASRHWSTTLHFNKGLAGADPATIAAVRDSALHPQALQAFALAIIASEGPAAFIGMPGAEPNLAKARDEAAAIDKAMRALRAVAPDAGSYVSESDYSQHDWQRAFWGDHYPRLLKVKRRYDPDGLFFVRHGVGSEGWSDDGFTPPKE